MTPLELIDQMLGRQQFSCSEKQMRFLRDLIESHLSKEVLEKEFGNRRKVELANLKRDVTYAKKDLEKATKVLAEYKKEWSIE